MLDSDMFSHAQKELVHRDLTWAIRSPPIHSTWREEPTESNCIVDDTPSEKRGRPLGRYFEELWALALGATPNVRGLERNVRLFDQKRVIGEADLVFEQNGQWQHLELAVKFYLGTGQCTSASDWYGPRTRDRLDIKLDKLNKQLRLFETDAGKHWLDERDITALKSSCEMKGYLFHPWKHWSERTFIVPDIVSPQHEKGFWLRVSELEALSGIAQRGRVLPKCDWLARATGGRIVPMSELMESVKLELDERGQPVMIGLWADGPVEVERGSIVPDDWLSEVENESS